MAQLWRWRKPVVVWSCSSRRVWRAEGWVCVWKVSTRTSVVMEQLCVLMVVVETQVMYARETCIKPGKSKHSLQVVPTATPVLKPCGNYVRLPVGGLVKGARGFTACASSHESVIVYSL